MLGIGVCGSLRVCKLGNNLNILRKLQFLYIIEFV
uniref:Uncharacterized protein n=1 Tax=viral metagenome TaxID=1070528 RepID=A0A6C0CCH4_9ZZZZ